MKYLLITFVMLMLYGCGRSNDNRQADNIAELQGKFKTLVTYAQSVPCTDGTEWKITPVGSRGCGGPERFIAYHKTTDEATLFKMINEYNAQLAAYNKRWNIISPCDALVPPTKVECSDGKPVLKY